MNKMADTNARFVARIARIFAGCPDAKVKITLYTDDAIQAISVAHDMANPMIVIQEGYRYEEQRRLDV